MTDSTAITTTGLRKTYRSIRGTQVAVAGLDLEVPTGGVHGFLGPNGSGKTTSIRMLLGLIRADAGRMEIFGRSVPHDLPAVIDRVGAIVESPRFFPAFSGRRNLELLAAGIGAPRARVDAVLDLTQLRGRAKDRYAAYSLGMKQRLAVASTLLKDPELLIFDEPTNGLDPAGIREIRDTMRRLADEGRTVLVSSHILAEVEQVADTVSIIGQGRLLAAGRVDEILGSAGAAGASVRVRVADQPRAAQILRSFGWEVAEETDHLSVTGCDDPAAVTRELALHGLYVSELTVARPGLEDVFLALTSDQGLGTSGGAR